MTLLNGHSGLRLSASGLLLCKKKETYLFKLLFFKVSVNEVNAIPNWIQSYPILLSLCGRPT